MSPSQAAKPIPAKPPQLRRATAFGRTARQDAPLLVRGQLSDRRPDLSLRQPAAPRAADGGAHQAAAAGPLGHFAGPELRLRSPEPADQRTQAQRHLHRRARARRAGAERVARIWKGPTSEVHPDVTPGRSGHASVVPPVFHARRRAQPLLARTCPARSTRAASWAIRCCTPTARRSTIPTCSWPASWATAKPRPGRWQEAGRATSFSIRCATAPCCRSCT